VKKHVWPFFQSRQKNPRVFSDKMFSSLCDGVPICNQVNIESDSHIIQGFFWKRAACCICCHVRNVMLHLSHATNATNATNGTNATNATNATNVTNVLCSWFDVCKTLIDLATAVSPPFVAATHRRPLPAAACRHHCCLGCRCLLPSPMPPTAAVSRHCSCVAPLLHRASSFWHAAAALRCRCVAPPLRCVTMS
jgi:hypothetical protein